MKDDLIEELLAENILQGHTTLRRRHARMARGSITPHEDPPPDLCVNCTCPVGAHELQACTFFHLPVIARGRCTACRCQAYQHDGR